MVRIIESSSGDGENKVFPKEPIDKNLLLSSLREFKPEGVVMGVEKVLQPRKSTFTKGKATLNMIFTIIGSFDECRLYDLDKEGQYIEEYDQATGKNRNKVIIGDAQLKTVFFPFYANCDASEIDEETDLIIIPKTSSYPFFRQAYVEYGALPKDCGLVAFATNYKEMQEVFNGYEFLGKYGFFKGKNSFEFLDCESLDKEE